MNKVFALVLLAPMLFGIIWFVEVHPAFAQESAVAQNARTRDCPPPTSLFPMTLNIPLGSVTEVNGLADYINEGYRFGVGVVLIIAIIMVVYGGFRYLVGSSMGDIARGKEIIRDAIVGMLIVLGAYTILQVVNPATTNLSPPALTNVRCTPLELTEAQQSNVCSTDADCGEDNKHCIPTETVYEGLSIHALRGAISGATDCVVDSRGACLVMGLGVPVIIAGGAGYIHNLGRVVKMCSDGTLGASCGSDVNCNDGLKCSSDWLVCIQNGGNPTGSPCDGNSDCSGGECSGDSGDANNRHRCRGHVRTFTHEVFTSSGFTIPESHFCTQNADCDDRDARCLGPMGLGVKACIKIEVADVTSYDEYGGMAIPASIPAGSPCFYGTDSKVVPRECAGGSTTMICLVCPPTAPRTWTFIASGPLTRIGECKPLEPTLIGTSCAGPAH